MPIHTIKNFNVGMTPNIYGDGISRMEHFGTSTGQARPYRDLVASTLTGGDISMKNLQKFARGASYIYSLGDEVGGTNFGRPTMARWNTSSYRWDGFQSFNETASYARLLFWYSGNLYGLWKGTTMWKMTPSGTLSTAHARTYTYYSNAITHSKDGLAYYGTDNILNRWNGSDLTDALTLPANFRITTISENGDFISIAGYDTQTLRATEYLWDRDSSLETLTQKYDLFDEIPYFNGTIGGTHFIILLRYYTYSVASTNISTPKMVIRYILGDKAIEKEVFRFSGLSMEYGSHYIDGDKIYFGATVVFPRETGSHWCVFQLDEEGKLTIAQNVGINDASGAGNINDVIRDGDAFLIAGATDGSWNTTSTYPSTYPAFLETVKYSSDNFSEDLDVLGYSVTMEPLPSGASVVVKTRADAETSWTTIATFDTDDMVDGSMNDKIAGTETSIATASERQFRIESLGGAVLTGFQVVLKGVANKPYHYASK